jgi:hypothetical protein
MVAIETKTQPRPSPSESGENGRIVCAGNAIGETLAAIAGTTAATAETMAATETKA